MPARDERIGSAAPIAAPLQVWIALAFYSRMVTGGCRTQADWIWIGLAL